MSTLHNNSSKRNPIDQQKIKIRPDLLSCQTIPATRIDVKLADPLLHLISSISEIEKLSYFTSKTDDNIELFQQLRVEMISTTDTLKQADLDQIAGLNQLGPQNATPEAVPY